VRLVQSARRDAGLQISDRIELNIKTESDQIDEAASRHREYISSQTLTSSLTLGEDETDTAEMFIQSGEVEGGTVSIRLRRAI